MIRTSWSWADSEDRGAAAVVIVMAAALPLRRLAQWAQASQWRACADCAGTNDRDVQRGGGGGGSKVESWKTQASSCVGRQYRYTQPHQRTPFAHSDDDPCARSLNTILTVRMVCTQGARPGRLRQQESSSASVHPHIQRLPVHLLGAWGCETSGKPAEPERHSLPQTVWCFFSQNRPVSALTLNFFACGALVSAD